MRRDVRTCPRPVFDNDLLTEPLRQPLPHNPGYSVSTAALGLAVPPSLLSVADEVIE
jgi:hypothetical protein